MQLDKTAIVISQRSALDLVDLSLIVMRRYWQSILFFAAAGVIPFAIADLVLLWPLCQYDSLLIASREISSANAYHWRYLWVITSLILIQSPFALSAVTYFIGQAVFFERPTAKQVFRAVWERFGAMVFIVGLVRMAILSFVPAVLMFLNPIFRPEIEIPLYFLGMCGAVYVVRGFRPFATEILLLERCPIFKSKDRPDQLPYAKRSRWLHSSHYYELLGVHFGVNMVEILTAFSLSMTSVFLVGVLTGIWSWGFWMDLFVYPMTIWMVSTWGAIIRFLLYMNSRIRTEGWEIELRLKAEAQRLEEKAAL